MATIQEGKIRSKAADNEIYPLRLKTNQKFLDRTKVRQHKNNTQCDHQKT